MKNRYRIVPDTFAGFEVQIKRWWFPVWLEVGTNTFQTVEIATAWIRSHQRAVYIV